MFIVFYSLYYVHYFILKYLLFTIVAAFGKDLFSLKELELQLLFSFRWWWSGGGVVRIPLVVEYIVHKKAGHNEDKQKQSEQVEERSRVNFAGVSPIPDSLFLLLDDL